MSYLRQCVSWCLPPTKQCLRNKLLIWVVSCKTCSNDPFSLKSWYRRKPHQLQKQVGRKEPFPGGEDPSTRNVRSQPQPPLPILRITRCQSRAPKDSSLPGTRRWESRLHFQLWHMGPCSCQTRESVSGWAVTGAAPDPDKVVCALCQQ